MVHVATGKLEALTICAVGIFFIIQPIVAPLSLFFLRWSPAMLPYHIFGGSQDELRKAEEEGSTLYWSVLIIDSTILSAAASACTSVMAVVLDAFLLVWAVLLAMRFVIELLMQSIVHNFEYQ